MVRNDIITVIWYLAQYLCRYLPSSNLFYIIINDIGKFGLQIDGIIVHQIVFSEDGNIFGFQAAANILQAKQLR